MAQSGTSTGDQPHHLGHRDRLRERFMATGGDGMQDYEVLELLLFTAIPRRDVKPLAKQLLQDFGSIGGVLSAEPERLRAYPHLKNTAIATLKLARAISARMLHGEIRGRAVISSWQQLIDYCRVQVGFESTEQFRILFLDRKNQLIADERQNRGTVDHAPVYPREVVRRALELQASALILVHNHPSGDPTPSRADIQMTQSIVEIAKPLGISVHDHIIVGKDGHASFKGLKLI